MAHKPNSTSFKPGQSGNYKGKPSGTKTSARRQGANKLKKLLKALEPLADDSIGVAAEIMQDESASQATRLNAAMNLLKKYTELTDVVYFEQLPKDEQQRNKQGIADDSEDEQEDASPKIALFSEKKSG